MSSKPARQALSPGLMWHTQDSQGHILVLAFRKKFSKPCKLFPPRSEAGGLNMALTRQSRPDSGLGRPHAGLDFQGEILKTLLSCPPFARTRAVGGGPQTLKLFALRSEAGRGALRQRSGGTSGCLRTNLKNTSQKREAVPRRARI